MNSLFSRISSLLPVLPVKPENGLAHQLMESADACAGVDPQHAQELRVAACAFLSVVR